MGYERDEGPLDRHLHQRLGGAGACQSMYIARATSVVPLVDWGSFEFVKN